MTVTFPKGFVWGVASAAHQSEGGNWNNDWWAWEHAPETACVEVSGDACDSLNRYAEDLKLFANASTDTLHQHVDEVVNIGGSGKSSVARARRWGRLAAMLAGSRSS